MNHAGNASLAVFIMLIVLGVFPSDFLCQICSSIHASSSLSSKVRVHSYIVGGQNQWAFAF